MAIQRKNIEKVLARQVTQLPSLTLQSYTPIQDSNNTLFRITASHAKSNNALTKGDYLTMCSATFGDQLSPVVGSLEEVGETRHATIISTLLVGNVISKPASKEEIKAKYRPVVANVFMDDEDKIWRLVGEGENRRLDQAIKEDLNKILESRLARKSSQVIAGVTNYVGVTPERGDYSIYYSCASLDYNYGYTAIADGNIYVMPRTGNAVEKIVAEQVIDCVEASYLPEDKRDTRVLAMMQMNTPRASSQNFSEELARGYLDYMKQIYADTPFFEQLEKNIANRRNLADLNKPLTTMEI